MNNKSKSILSMKITLYDSELLLSFNGLFLKQLSSFFELW